MSEAIFPYTVDRELHFASDRLTSVRDLLTTAGFDHHATHLSEDTKLSDGSHLMLYYHKRSELLDLTHERHFRSES